jgi:hypothetical protein
MKRRTSDVCTVKMTLVILPNIAPRVTRPTLKDSFTSYKG